MRLITNETTFNRKDEGGPAGGQAAFVFTCERSGSTLLQYLLDTHPAICAPGELGLGHLAERLLFAAARTMDALPGSECAQETDTIYQRARASIDALMAPHAARSRKQIWIDKTPWNTMYAKHLLAVYPESRFICLYRSCRDVVHSCLEAGRKWGIMDEHAHFAARWPDDPISAYLENWIDKTMRIRGLEREYPQQSLSIRYEDLVYDPANELEKIWSFFSVADDNEITSHVIESALAKPRVGSGGDLKIRSTTRISAGRVATGEKLDFKHCNSLLRDQANFLLESLGYEPSI